MAVIDRIVVYILLTILVQLVAWQIHFWPLLSAIAVTMLILAWRQHSKMSAYRTRSEMALNPARFSPDKLDCYVRFQGELTAADAYKLPFSGRTCAFYQAEVFVEWETKKKKPARGMETHRKPLFREQSSPELEFVVGEQRVCVKTEDFTKSWLQLRKNENTQGVCPAQISHLADGKYETYKTTECFACNGDRITAQGRLTRRTDGRLFIKPTRRLEFPSFVTIRMQLPEEVASKALSDARLKQVNTAGLIINALLLFYASFII